MSFSFRDKGRLSDRLRGKTCDEIIKELRDHLHQDREMSFDSSPSWGGFSSSPAFARAGFPFMDQDMMSGPDMRAHFADLANRHPEFAEHLRPSAWNTVPETDPHFFHSTASGPNLYRQRHSSGGSGSGSYGEGEAIPIPVIHEDSGGGEPTSSRSRARKIPQYGMRNTVDLGESQKSAATDSNEGDSRSQRSWSAPPDNRTQAEPPQPKRFVTRVDVNNGPANPTNSSENEAPPGPTPGPSVSSPGGKPPPFPKPSGVGPTPQSTTKQGNVRHIPIFVEGRDEPILPKTHEGQSFSSSHSSSGFGQPNASYTFASASPGSNASAFASSHSPSGSTRSYSSAPHPQASGPIPRPSGPFPHPSAPHPQTSTPHPQASAPQKPKHETPPSQPQPQPPKPSLPKDPIARVKAIQEEVNELKKKVEIFSGSRSDKEYIYLDEMLTRNLLKLDDIETEGKDSIRQARKEAIRSIEKCISILESKAPLPREINVEAEQGQTADIVMDEECGADGCVEMSQGETNANGEAKDLSAEPMEVQQQLDNQEPSNLDTVSTVMKTDGSSQSETPMEVAQGVCNDKGKGDGNPDTSEPRGKPEEAVQNPEMMEVINDSRSKGESQDVPSPAEGLSKAESQINGEEKSEKVAGETVSTVGVNTNCDEKIDSADSNVDENGEANSTVTEVKFDEAASVVAEQEDIKSGEAVVVEDVLKNSDSCEPVDIPNECVEEPKDSASVDNQAVETTDQPNMNDGPPVDSANKEVPS